MFHSLTMVRRKRLRMLLLVVALVVALLYLRHYAGSTGERTEERGYTFGDPGGVEPKLGQAEQPPPNEEDPESGQAEQPSPDEEEPESDQAEPLSPDEEESESGPAEQLPPDEETAEEPGEEPESGLAELLQNKDGSEPIAEPEAQAEEPEVQLEEQDTGEEEPESGPVEQPHQDWENAEPIAEAEAQAEESEAQVEEREQQVEEPKVQAEEQEQRTEESEAQAEEQDLGEEEQPGQAEQPHQDWDNAEGPAHTTADDGWPPETGRAREQPLQVHDEDCDCAEVDELPALNGISVRMLTENPGLCADPDIRVIVFVLSQPLKHHTRNAIRATYGNRKLFPDVRVVFAVGLSSDEFFNQKVLEENNEKQDIVIGDYLDTYYNCTYKVFSAMYWIDKYCNHAPFTVKLDEDTFMNTYNLLSYLDTRQAVLDRNDFNQATTSAVNGSFYCQVNYRNHAIRVPGHGVGKWYVSPEEYAQDFYPLPCAGGAYMFDTVLASVMWRGSYHVNFLKFEDVFFPGIVREAYGAEIANVTDVFGDVIHQDSIFLHEQDMLPQSKRLLWKQVEARRADDEPIGALVQTQEGVVETEGVEIEPLRVKGGAERAKLEPKRVKVAPMRVRVAPKRVDA